MKVLILGGGGREHALARQISLSTNCEQLFVAPGNPGSAQLATELSVNPTDFEAVKTAVLDNAIDMVVVGPEQPLVNGIADFFAKDKSLKDVKFIGPSEKGALLEGSKERAKEFMAMYDIPTAAYESFNADSVQAGQEFIETLKPPFVLKADGLAGGKGVLILDDVPQAQHELELMLKKDKFGEAGKTVVIEEFLDGEELSLFVLTDGRDYKILPTAQDYKRIGEGDTGLNTGGMGAISPSPLADETLVKKVEERIIAPTIKGLSEESIDYKGFVFFGLMVVNGNPYVIEYNVRMGDPESQAVLPRIQSDFLDLLDKTALGKLSESTIEIDRRHTGAVVAVSGGYPESYEKGKPITGNEKIEESLLFHAGTKSVDGQLQTSGGRVLALTAFGENHAKALNTAYAEMEKINFDKIYYRKDLGK